MKTIILSFLLWSASVVVLADSYQHFNAAIYTRAYEVEKMADLDWLAREFAIMERDLKVGKIYLETHRDRLLVDDNILASVSAFFRQQDIEVAGGITLTIDEPNRFETFCYSNPEHRAWVQRVVEHTARHFDEIILDDFYFTSCKSEVEIEAKGEGQSWTEYRLALLNEAAESLILQPARKVNPDVKVIIKYPNWYDDFEGLGFDLSTGPQRFDGVYTGTETRDAVRSAQHLQQYHGFQIFRYFDNLRPGHNLGGWVDTGGMGTLDRYAEQLWLTLFAKAPEITLFDFRQLRYPLSDRHRGTWQDGTTSVNFEAIMSPYRNADGSYHDTLRVSRLAGWSLDKIDPLIGQLGEPTGIWSYQPHHANGEDYLHNFIGMIGIPIHLTDRFPEDDRTVLLTAAAGDDAELVAKMQRHLRRGNDVVITSGLLQKLGGKIDSIAELRVTDRKALVETFMVARGELQTIDSPMIIPQIDYHTNDSWALASAVSGPMGWPMLHDADYSTGQLYVLTIPDNFADLYRLPVDILTRVRQAVMKHETVRLDGPGSISFMPYDNNTFVGMSFRDDTSDITIVTDAAIEELVDLESGEVLSGELLPENPPGTWNPHPDAGKRLFKTQINAHSYRAFKAQ